MTYAIDLNAIDVAIGKNSIVESESVKTFAKGASLAAARRLACEFYPFCFEFPLFLAAAISHLRDERARLLLVGNLYEEHGGLDAAKIHPELFRRYMRELGLDPAAHQDGESSVLGARTAKRVTDICRHGPAHRALAALYAIELLFGPLCEELARGLSSLSLSDQAMNFFVVHSGADVVHAEQLRRALAGAIRNHADFLDALDIASEVSGLFYDLFELIARAPRARTTTDDLALDRAS